MLDQPGRMTRSLDRCPAALGGDLATPVNPLRYGDQSRQASLLLLGLRSLTAIALPVSTPCSRGVVRH